MNHLLVLKNLLVIEQQVPVNIHTHCSAVNQRRDHTHTHTRHRHTQLTAVNQHRPLDYYGH